uniref:Uncharacterized protein n=1 Tax=Arundo donax TaxID=35708 RepID=A0A0A9FR07_ARUDO
MIKRNDGIVIIPKGNTQLSKSVDFIILPFLCLQMITNLVCSPIWLEIFIHSLSTRVEMKFS